MFTRKVDLAYGSIALFTTIVHNVFLLYHVETFLSIYKIDKFSFWVGEIIFLLWNSINDPLLGWLSDGAYLGKGSETCFRDIVLYRIRALRFNGPLLSVSFLLIWFAWTYPGLQFVVCLCLYDGFLTVMDLQHSALLADLALSLSARARLNFYSSACSAIGATSVFLSYAFWNRERFMSFQVYCTMLTLFSIVGYLVSTTVLMRHYRSQQLHLGRDQHKSQVVNSEDCDRKSSARFHQLKTYARQVASHKNFLVFAVMNLIQVFHCHFNSNFFPLFLEILLGNAVSPLTASLLLGLSFVAPHINNLYFLSLCKVYGAYRVVHFLFLVKLMLSLVIYLVGRSHIWLLCLFIASNRIFTEGTCNLLNLVITDLVDEDMVIHKRQQPVSALVFGTSALLSKPGQTLAPLIGTWLLVLQTGHDVFRSASETPFVTKDLQSMDAASRSQYQDGCFTLLVYVPMGCAVLQLLFWSRFTLHGHRLSLVKYLRSDGFHGSDV
ncbi:PREDICTED: transmembrane protein 180-like [Priapulus caudatus]|uniref:Transmembrane protein 180-like n=1 Tax=Priapulus caudatus TaxID=37621 RepID=A0ABM1E4B1_PRICU|nr:PREDICTED: transmembrane protein 180-like [Priapulus caudatus]